MCEVVNVYFGWFDEDVYVEVVGLYWVECVELVLCGVVVFGEECGVVVFVGVEVGVCVVGIY